MKVKVLYVCLCISILICASLGHYIVKHKPVCERVHLDDIDRTKDVVPDEETALRIAEAIVDSHEYWEWEEDVDYEVEILFNEMNYEWSVQWQPPIPEGAIMLDGGKTVFIRRDTGAISISAWY